ncbi:MAG: hypothetical protein ACFFDT_25665 [Candidatus Hodarchaeota archaeon]
MSRTQIAVYKQLWEYFLRQGLKTIEIIEEEDAWEFRTFPQEYSVRETFHHTIQAIYEDAGRWFLDEFSKYVPIGVPSEDLTRAVSRMISAFEKFKDEELSKEMTFQWGEKTTIGKAIQQNLFHAVGHFSQLRNWAGISTRRQGKGTREDIV